MGSCHPREGVGLGLVVGALEAGQERVMRRTWVQGRMHASPAPRIDTRDAPEGACTCSGMCPGLDDGLDGGVVEGQEGWQEWPALKWPPRHSRAVQLMRR
jgi:hypothetical protein